MTLIVAAVIDGLKLKVPELDHVPDDPLRLVYSVAASPYAG
jgi:hypothetical protein